MTQIVDLLPVATGTLSLLGEAVVGSNPIPASEGWTCVDDPVGNFDDETVDPVNATFVRLPNEAGTSWSFKLATPSSQGAVKILSIVQAELFFVIRRRALGGGARVDCLVRDSLNSAISGILIDTSFLGTTYVTFSTIQANNPITGQPWSLEDFETQRIELVIRRHDPDGGSSAAHCTSCYARLTYNPDAWATAAPPSGSWSAGGSGASGWSSLGAASSTWTTS